jgi:hypothetical protein
MLLIGPGKSAISAPRWSTKPKKIDIALVEHLAGIGMTDADICREIGVSENTLARHSKKIPELGEAIKKGRQAARCFVSNKLWELIERGHLGAIIWYEKTRGGMTDGVEIKLPRLVPETKQSLLLAFTSRPVKEGEDDGTD